jgi:hypothetical protein
LAVFAPLHEKSSTRAFNTRLHTTEQLALLHFPANTIDKHAYHNHPYLTGGAMFVNRGTGLANQSIRIGKSSASSGMIADIIKRKIPI